LREWNRTNADPPWTDAELAHKVESAGERVAVLPERKFNDPHQLAADFPGVWCYWHEGLYCYDGRRYVAVADSEVRSRLRTYIGERFERVYTGMLKKYQGEQEAHETLAGAAAEAGGKAPKEPKKPTRHPVTEHLVNEVLAELRAQSQVPGAFNMPCMLPEGKEPHLLTFTNGLLDVGTGKLLPHSRDWFSTVCIPYAYDPTAVDEVLPSALAVWFDEDEERAALCQEWAGYLLTRSTDMQAFMILTGDGSNGKGTFTAVLEAMLGGAANVSYLPWEALGERFQLYGTLGKLLNVSDDIGEFDKSAEGTLKWFVGGKPVTFERKGKDPFTATPTARLMLSCNQAPRISDRTDGVWRRALVIPFDGKIPEGKKRYGMDKAEWWTAHANMPGILNWAVAGYRRQRDAGKFTRPKRCEEAKRQLRLESNPALGYVTEELVADPDARDLPSSDLYEGYRNWCATNGYKPLGAIMFGKEVKRKFRDAESKTRKVSGKHAKYWHGVRRFDAIRDSGLRLAPIPTEGAEAGAAAG
jgi:P4 family phage/plasmid primase-like protien